MNRNPKNRQSRKKISHAAALRKARKARQRRRILTASLVAAGLALVLGLLIVKIFPAPRRDVPVSSAVQPRAGTTASAATPADAPVEAIITLVPQATMEPTPRPTPEPTPRPTPEPTPEPTPTPQITPEPTAFEYLPVVHRADTKSKVIAITVDDCYQLDNLQTIVDVAEKNGAALTLFPVGENLSKSGMPALMKHCAFDLGFEIENHTWSHDRIFRLPDDEMAGEIWKQDAALDRALGVNYQEHFLRLMGGDGDTDPRIHSYLKQLGYLGIANWSVSGSDSDMKHIKNSLAPGQIYLFHCTDPDTKKLKEFIPWAVSQGYKLVTLNKLFGLPANETSTLTDSAMPQPTHDVDDHHTLKEGEYTWVALQLQEKLRSLGYLKIDGPSTGYYGPQTVKAVAAFQKDQGLPVTGEADPETQQRLLES